MDNLDITFNCLVEELGIKSDVISKRFKIGTNKVPCMLVYVNGLSDKTLIDRDVLCPLMTKVPEELTLNADTLNFICENFIPMSNTKVSNNVSEVIDALKIGKSVIFLEVSEDFIILDTIGGAHRSISDPINESSVKAPREGFVENVEVNLSILKRILKDKNLKAENIKIGMRSQTDTFLVYIDDIVDKNILEDLKDRLSKIDVDSISANGMIEQYIEENTWSPFPQGFSTERPDIVKANLLEGRIAIVMNGSPQVMTVPAIFFEFFQGIEDYTQRTLISSFARLLRALSVFLVVTLTPFYLTLISYNVELIPIKFMVPIIQSRSGIALSPFLEILLMEIIVEFLREGGLRLPIKIASTLSIVGGIIIGNTAVDSKVVSPTTLLIVGTSVVATFLIPNYQMSLSVRFLRFPMLFLAHALGFFGIATGWFLIMVHLCSLKSIGIPYMSLHKTDLKDIFIRAPLWQMNERPKSIPNNNMFRQTDFRNLFRRNKK